MSTFSEDDIRRAAEVREWLVKEVTNKKEELDKLRDTLLIVDSLLKKTSFITASHLESSASNLKDRNASEYQSLHKEETVQSKPSIDSTTSTNTDYEQDDNQDIEIRSLRRAKDNLLISDAEYTSTYVRIPLLNDINLNINTPPFKSFF